MVSNSLLQESKRPAGANFEINDLRPELVLRGLAYHYSDILCSDSMILSLRLTSYTYLLMA